MKKIMILVMVLLCLSIAYGSYTNQIAGTIGSLSGTDTLNGAAITVTVQTTAGVPIMVQEQALMESLAKEHLYYPIK